MNFQAATLGKVWVLAWEELLKIKTKGGENNWYKTNRPEKSM